MRALKHLWIHGRRWPFGIVEFGWAGAALRRYQRRSGIERELGAKARWDDGGRNRPQRTILTLRTEAHASRAGRLRPPSLEAGQPSVRSFEEVSRDQLDNLVVLSRWRHGFEPRWDYKRFHVKGGVRLRRGTQPPKRAAHVPHVQSGRDLLVGAIQSSGVVLLDPCG